MDNEKLIKITTAELRNIEKELRDIKKLINDPFFETPEEAGAMNGETELKKYLSLSKSNGFILNPLRKELDNLRKQKATYIRTLKLLTGKDDGANSAGEIPFGEFNRQRRDRE